MEFVLLLARRTRTARPLCICFAWGSASGRACTITNNRMWQCSSPSGPPTLSLSFCLAYNQHENILKHLISSRLLLLLLLLFFFFFFFFFSCSCSRSPSEVVAGRQDWTHSTHMQHPKKVWTEACEKPISLWVSPLMIRTCGLSTERRRYSWSSKNSASCRKERVRSYDRKQV